MFINEDMFSSLAFWVYSQHH